jgi:hypothetical protein
MLAGRSGGRLCRRDAAIGSVPAAPELFAQGKVSGCSMGGGGALASLEGEFRCDDSG